MNQEVQLPDWVVKQALRMGLDAQEYYQERLEAAQKGVEKGKLLFREPGTPEWLRPGRLFEAELPEQTFSLEIFRRE